MKMSTIVVCTRTRIQYLFFFLTGFDTDKIRSLGRQLLLSNCRKIDYNIIACRTHDVGSIYYFTWQPFFRVIPVGRRAVGTRYIPVVLRVTSAVVCHAVELRSHPVNIDRRSDVYTVYTIVGEIDIPSRGRSSRGTRPTWAQPLSELRKIKKKKISRKYAVFVAIRRQQEYYNGRRNR